MSAKTHRAMCACAAALLVVTPVAFSSDDSCDSAYWDGRKLQDFARCQDAAITGNAEAEFQYALILWSGHDRKADHRSALEWLRKSARQSHRLAQVWLGSFLS